MSPATSAELEIKRSRTTTMFRTVPSQCVIYAVITSICGCYGCYIPPVEEKLYYSDALAYGQVKELHKGAFDLPDTKYIAEIKLYCVFKGGSLSPTINLTVPDYDSDPCETYSLTPGLKYLLYLDTTDGIYRLTFNAEEVADTEYLDYIPFLCDVNINYPIGVGVDTAEETCPEPYHNPDHCTRYAPDYEETDAFYEVTNPFYEETNSLYETDTQPYEPYEITESSDWTRMSTPSAEHASSAATVDICLNVISTICVFIFILLTSLCGISV